MPLRNQTGKVKIIITHAPSFAACLDFQLNLRNRLIMSTLNLSFFFPPVLLKDHALERRKTFFKKKKDLNPQYQLFVVVIMIMMVIMSSLLFALDLMRELF